MYNDESFRNFRSKANVIEYHDCKIIREEKSGDYLKCIVSLVILIK